MNTTLHSDLPAFIDTTRPFLEENEAANNLVLGILTSLQRQPRRRRNRPVLAVVEDETAIKLMGVMTPPKKMMLAGLETETEAAKQLAGYLRENNKKIPAIFGPSSLALAFAQEYLEERPFQEGTPQAIYALRQVNNITISNGTLRNPYAEELDLMTDWIFGFQRDVHTEQSPSLAMQVAGQLMQNRDLFIWADEDDAPKAMATKSRPTANGIAINMVYTPPEYRGNGFATALVAGLSRYLLDEGYQFCTLFTDLTNPISNHVYQKIGYNLLQEFQDYFWE
ncbi:MAG: GNAT family N-acetyltransferase [Chloroflexota bacterium]